MIPCVAGWIIAEGQNSRKCSGEEHPIGGADYKCNRKLQRVVSRLQARPEAGVIDRGLRKLLVISAAVTPS
jgi:hypothetical protein